MIIKIACDIGLVEIDIDYDKKIFLLRCNDDIWFYYSQMYSFGEITLVMWIDMLEKI